jgi:hypothetical protein
MTGRKKSSAHLSAIAGMIAVTGATLPVSAVAQTTADVTDLIKKLQSEIGTMVGGPRQLEGKRPV